jgi:hypothetical protein
MLDPLFWSGWESRFMLGVLITGKPLPVDSFGCVKWIMVARLEHLSKSLCHHPAQSPYLRVT